MLSNEWLSRYGLLENFNASVTRTRTGTWTTGVTAIALCTSCSRAKNQCFEQTYYKKNLSFFSPNEIFNFRAGKNLCIQHGQVFIMLVFDFVCKCLGHQHKAFFQPYSFSYLFIKVVYMFDELVISVDASTTVAVTTFALIYNISMSSIYNMAGKES